MTQEKKSKPVDAEPARGRPSEDAFCPLVDIYEAEDGTTILVAELPGAQSESLDVRVDKGVLTVRADGSLPPVDEGYVATYTDFAGGEYFRAFALSDEVDREHIEASLDEGVLTLRLPKAAAAKKQKIEIQ